MKRQLIKTDGTIVDLPQRLSMSEIAKLIGADTLDTVILHHMGHPLHVMCVNDKGYETQVVESAACVELRPMRALLPLNQEATRLFLANCRSGTTHQIVGDVVVVPDSDFEL